MKLAILICHLNEPYYNTRLKRLTTTLDRQIAKTNGEVVYRIHDAGRSMTTGRKRNELIQHSSSEYFVFIDSDDMVTSDYVQTILEAIDKGPDCITYRGYMTTSGKSREEWVIKLGSQYITKDGVHYRWPNHISVMKRSKVGHVKFPDIWKQEDYQWSQKIHALKLLKTEVHIDREMYHYDYEPNKPDPQRRIRYR